MGIDKMILRNVTEDDAPVLRLLASKCPPLDVHTHYTYWIICKFFDKCSFLLADGDNEIGYITAVETDDCVFIWQIGVLEPYRSKGLSRKLIGAVVEYARQKDKDMQVSIEEKNIASYSAFKNFSEKNNLVFEKTGSLRITDLLDKAFCEEEIIYDIRFQ